MQNGIDWPDIQLNIFSVGITLTIIEDMRKFSGFNETILRPVMEPVLGKDGFILVVTLVRPQSKGEIKLQDRNPFSKPLIDPNFLESKRDVNTLIEGKLIWDGSVGTIRKHFFTYQQCFCSIISGIKLSLKLIKTKIFAKLGAKYQQTSFPECQS